MQNNPQPKWESLVLIRNIVLAQIFGFCQLARVMKTLKSFFFQECFVKTTVHCVKYIYFLILMSRFWKGDFLFSKY